MEPVARGAHGDRGGGGYLSGVDTALGGIGLLAGHGHAAAAIGVDLLTTRCGPTVYEEGEWWRRWGGWGPDSTASSPGQEGQLSRQRRKIGSDLGAPLAPVFFRWCHGSRTGRSHGPGRERPAPAQPPRRRGGHRWTTIVRRAIRACTVTASHAGSSSTSIRRGPGLRTAQKRSRRRVLRKQSFA